MTNPAKPTPDVDTSWHDDAACRGEDPVLWFGADWEPADQRAAREAAAKAICATCPVRARCLDHAVEHPERYGLWGGLTEEELAAERRRRGRRAAHRSDHKPLITCATCGRQKRLGGLGPSREQLCDACRSRWTKAGRPAHVPPPPTADHTRREAA